MADERTRDEGALFATDRILLAHNVKPVVSGVVNDNTTLLALVAAGQGVAIVPSLVLDDKPGGVVVADQHLGVQRTIFAVARRAMVSEVQPLLDGLAYATTTQGGHGSTAN